MTSAGKRLLENHRGGCDYVDEDTLAEWIVGIEKEAVERAYGSPFDAPEEAVDRALLHVLQWSDKQHAANWGVASHVIRDLAQDGYMILQKLPTTPRTR